MGLYVISVLISANICSSRLICFGWFENIDMEYLFFFRCNKSSARRLKFLLKLGCGLKLKSRVFVGEKNCSAPNSTTLSSFNLGSRLLGWRNKLSGIVGATCDSMELYTLTAFLYSLSNVFFVMSYDESHTAACSPRKSKKETFPPPIISPWTFGTILKNLCVLIDSCVLASNVRILSTSSPKNSIL